jgi:riboflavin kinase
MIVLDLDGLILDTETLCMQVAAEVLAKRGATLTARCAAASIGRRPLDAWTAVARELNLGGEEVGAELFAESEPLLTARWGEARPMPGALRLLRHLAQHDVAVAVATSTPRSTFEKKLAAKPEMRALLTRCGGSVACGDEVSNGKPAADVFELAVAKLLLWKEKGGGGGGGGESNDDAKPFLPAAREALRQGRVAVFEDAPSGVEGALAAGARVVVVPSLRDPSAYPAADACCSSGGGGGGGGDEKDGGPTHGCVAAQVPSLLAFDPACLGLPPFTDLVPSASLPKDVVAAGGRAAVPLDPPLRIRGKVVRGFGRGSRELGIPTANVDPDALVTELAEAVTGVYVGWACVIKEDGQVRLAASGGGVGGDEQGGSTSRDGLPEGCYPTAMSCGYNPQFNNTRRTLEPWILADFGEGVEFYGEEIRLVVAGYLRPEAAFVSVPALVEQIHGDARDARRALADPRFLTCAKDVFLTRREG